MHKVGVVIAAGGKGVRMGSRTPKQFLRIEGLSVIEHVISRFARVREIDEIVVVVPGNDCERIRRMVRRRGLRKVLAVVPGGKERQDSVRSGLEGFSVRPDIVLIHDAARPLVTKRVITQVIRETEIHRAAVVGVKVLDTIKREGSPGFYVETLSRDGLWAVQTPQGFQFTVLMDAHDRARVDAFIGTDDASLVERLGIPVKIVEGDRRNIKITSRDDMEIVRKWLKRG